MRGIKAWSNGLIFVVGLCVIMDAAIAAGDPPNHNLPDPTPIWDKVLPTAERFVILSAFGGAAVRDNETGLVWQKSPEFNQSATFYAAGVTLCHVAKTGGRMGWRLPTIPELSSLADTHATPGTVSLPPGHPFGFVTASTVFFTLGVQETSPSTFEVVLVKFTPGGPGGILPISSQFAPKLGVTPATAWCVRSGNPILPE
jgi:hypothetical protein